MENNKKSKVPALSRAIDILDFVAENGHCTITDVATSLMLPKSSLYLMIDELKRLRLLAQSDDGSLRLGLKLMELGSRSVEQLDLRKIAKDHLTRLMLDTGLVCHLGILDGDDPIYLLKIDSQSTIQVRSWEGKRVSLYSSALGKCLLAWAGPQRQKELMSAIDFKVMTPYTLSCEEELVRELTLIRQRGWSFDNQEDLLNIQCISAPVFDSSHRLVAAISAVGTTLQVNESNLQALAERVMHAAALISKEMGCETQPRVSL
ncbi:IclR family transcriptional regulator [Leminorella grimontii]|uniref:IclR family transcriptional regulator n=1 Tax=Leminorella grimontii TaxID=82981 RepID=UPI00322050B1